MAGTRDALLYFAPVPWDSYPQRPHYFARHFLGRRDGPVVWIDPYPTRLPRIRDLRTRRPASRIDAVRPAGLTVISLRAIPIEPLPIGRWLNRSMLRLALTRRVAPLVEGCTVRIGIGRPSALALGALTWYRPAASFYDAMDDFPEFYDGISKRAIAATERAIVRGVGLVVTPSSALWDKFEPVGNRRLLVRNAFDMATLPPLPIARSGNPVFGYVGCISDWFDWSTIAQLARAFPQIPVRIVGPCYAPPPHDLPGNVSLFPACSHQRAIEHFASFSVGLIPFKRQVLTDGVDPIKYYGYRAMGLPVLSTRFGEMAHRGAADGVFLIDERTPIERAAAAALDATCDASTIERFRREHTWERRLSESGLDAALGFVGRPFQGRRTSGAPDDRVPAWRP